VNPLLSEDSKRFVNSEDRPEPGTTTGGSHMMSSIRGSFVVALAAFAMAVVPTTATAQGVLFVENNNVGIGTATPSFHLEVVGTDDAATRVQVVNNSGTTASRTLFKLENNGTNRFAFENTATGDSWTFNDAGGNFLVTKVGSGVNEAIFSPGGNLTIAGTLSQGSSRAIKQDIQEVDSLNVLEALVDMPISMWSYNHDAGVRHLGPMAEDFHETFGLGRNATTISSIDTGGVALAAIKGLHQQIQERDAKIQLLEERLEKLESIVATK
jgi:hypothetical protein